MVNFHLIGALPTFFYATIIYMAVVTVVLYSYLYKVFDPTRYIQLFLLLTVVKLIACLAYCTVVVLKKRQDWKSDVIFFLVIYIVFTAVEVVFLYRRTAQKGR